MCRRNVVAAVAAALVAIGSGALSAESPRDPTLTLDEALERALRSSPRLAGAQEAVAAAAARREQADVWPNPELSVASEGFAGNAELTGFDGAESSVEITQPLPLGQRRRQRAVAGAELLGIEADAVAELAAVRAGVTADFYRVLAAQRRVALTEELAALAAQVAASVAVRVDAGKVPPAEAARARVPVVEARISLVRAEQQLAAARQALSARWGGLEAPAVVGDLDALAPPPQMSDLLPMLPETAVLAVPLAEVKRREAVLVLERRLGWPEVAVTAGRRREEPTGAEGWNAGVAVELPLFDRNRDGVRAAEHELRRSQHEVERVRADAVADLAAARAALAAAWEQARLEADDAVPAAEQAFRAVEIAYREGKLDLLEVLQAQRALFETRLGLLDALEAYHTAGAELQRLVFPAETSDGEIW